MSIPHIKRRHNINANIIADNGPASVIPLLRQGRGAPKNPRAGQGQAPSARAGLAVLLLMLALPVGTGQGEEPTDTFPEDFEDDGLGQDPSHDGYTFTKANQNVLVSSLQAHSGNQSLRMSQTVTGVGEYVRFAYSGIDFCAGIEAEWWVWMDSYAPGASTADVFKISKTTPEVVIAIVGIETAGNSIPGDVEFGGSNFGPLPLSTWVDFRLTSDFLTGTDTCDGSSHSTIQCLSSNVMSINFCSTPAPSTYAAGTYNNFEFNQGSTTLTSRAVFIDDIGPCNFVPGGQCVPVQPAPTITGQTVLVNNLVGYSMDATGQNIIVRYNSGADVATYGTQDLTQIATAATGCSRFDGVVTTNLEGEIWTSYAACQDNAGTVDTLRIRDGNLAIPTFYTDDCEELREEDVEDDDLSPVPATTDIHVPNNMQQMGTISDLAFDYRECINPPGAGLSTFASWTFSSSFDGWIGAFGVSYSSGLTQPESYEEHAPAIDTSSAPLEVTDFCSWRGPDGEDYIGGVSQDGVAAVYEVERDASVSALTGQPDLDFEFIQKFRNSGPYSGSSGIACAQDKVAIQTPAEIRILTNVTTTPVLLRTISNPPAVGARGLAFTGSGEYLAYVSASGIRVHQIDTGATTGVGATPTGTWRGMEFDFSGQNLVAFTNDQFVLFDAEEVTCELDNNCEQLGGIGDDETGPTGTSTSTPTGGAPGVGEGDLAASPYFWILVWLLVINVVIAALSYATRAGFGGSVYLVASMVVYIIGMIGYGVDDVSPWPLVAVVVAIVGLAIGGYIRR